MKFKIREQEPKAKEKIVEFYLVEDHGKIELKANLEGESPYIICVISEDGLMRWSSIADDLGFSKDSMNKIKLNE